MNGRFLCVIAVVVRGIGSQLLNQSSHDVFYTYEATIIVHCQSKAKGNTYTTLRYVSSCDLFHRSDLQVRQKNHFSLRLHVSVKRGVMFRHCKGHG